jgi:hemolysin activation/secretion protein
MVNRNWRYLRKGIVFFLFFSLAVIPFSKAVFAMGEDSGEDDPSASKVEQALAGRRPKSADIIIKEQVTQQIPKPTLPEGLTLIKEVRVVGATVLAPQALEALKRKYENRQVTGRMIQQCADLVTRAYAREGYITSYGFVDPKELGSGILTVVVKEGRTGKITIEGNKYFSTAILEKKITLKEGDLFNFRKLNLDVYRINRQQDRKMKITCDPNVQTGITDVVLQVKDKSPLHLILQYDNYGSEYIGYRRYKTYFINNNLTGNDDSLQFKAQLTEGNSHKLFDFDYFLPLNNEWKFEGYYMPFKREDYLTDGNVTDDFEKHARKFYFNFFNSLINEPDTEFISHYGFVYKDIHWWKYGRRQTRDRFRALTWGLDLNKADDYGRWVISNDLEAGIPRMAGGSTAEDTSTSVQGAGGKYVKNHLVVARRQKLFAGIDFISKSHWQISNQALTGVNVFSVGGFFGVIDNRGYPRAQAYGDNGISSMAGFTFPVYGLPRTMNAPFSKTKLYDDIKLFTFYEWARADLKSPSMTDKERTDLSSVGCGFTFNIPDRSLSTRLDIGWAIGKEKPKDGDPRHILYSITQAF